MHHPINKVLSIIGLQLRRYEKKPPNEELRKSKKKCEDYYEHVLSNNRGFNVIWDFRYQGGDHPSNIADIHCNFASYHLFKAKPTKVLDIGSWRLFLIGILAHYDVTTIDFRKRQSTLENETIITCCAKSLDLADNSFDAVISLAAFSHFGLGRYGDEFDLDADIKAFNEMIRVLKPGGYMIFNTLITRSQPTILFNRCRIYDFEMIRNFCSNLDCVDEEFASHRLRRICSFEELTTDPKHFDSYLGCWKKK